MGTAQGILRTDCYSGLGRNVGAFFTDVSKQQRG